jgi:hypothetical protein
MYEFKRLTQDLNSKKPYLAYQAISNIFMSHHTGEYRIGVRKSENDTTFTILLDGEVRRTRAGYQLISQANETLDITPSTVSSIEVILKKINKVSQ